jgi:mono/diheme cytochrome c family protein
MALRRFFGPSAVFAAALLVATASIGASIGAKLSAPSAALVPVLMAGQAAPSPDLTGTAAKFEQTCAGCHGAGGISGDRAPALANSAKLRALSDAEIGAIIRNGTAGASSR